MKTKLLKWWSLWLFPLLLSGCDTYREDISNYTGYGNGARKFGVTVWTNSESNINVYINSEQVGVLSQKFDSAPECGSAGCVYYDTEDGGIKISVRGESVDGKVKWEEKSLRLNRNCRKVQFVKNAEGATEILLN